MPPLGQPAKAAASPAHRLPVGPWPAAILVVSGAAAYAHTLSSPFIFDDRRSITDNPTIRSLWPPWAALSPPGGSGQTVEGRPLLNLSLAINHAISGLDVWSYHALNGAIHILAGLVLFGIVRRTLARWNPSMRDSTPLALAIALIWTVHPLQTESVTYIIQRAESLMGLFYLLTLYCFVRKTSGEAAVRPALWGGLSVLACLCGMATKEVMISAPIIVLLYDRTFVGGTFQRAIRERWVYYLALGVAELFLIGLALHTGTRGGSAGFGIAVRTWDYAKTQFPAVTHYLRLSAWPRPLIFDYGTRWSRGLGDWAPYAVFIGALAGATAVALWQRRALGFLGAWFFAILAPTSLIAGNRQTLAEHRMYLPLAAVVALGACAGWTLAERRGGRGVGRTWIGLLFASAVGLWAMTVKRNEDYRTVKGMWEDTVAKCPGNPWAHDTLGSILAMEGQPSAAIEQYRQAVRLRPDFAEAHNNLGMLLGSMGRTREAIAENQEAVRLRPDFADAHNNLGNALNSAGEYSAALAEYEKALQLRPDFAEAHNNAGVVLRALGRTGEAIAQAREAVRLSPDFADAHFNLALAWLDLPGKLSEAAAELAATLRIQPKNERALQLLAKVRASER